MGDGRGSDRSALLVEFDVAMCPIHRSGDEKAQDEQQQPIFDDDIGGKGEEIEADVLAVLWVALAIRHLIDEAQEHAPVADLPGGNQDRKDDGDPAMSRRHGRRWPISTNGSRND